LGTAATSSPADADDAAERGAGARGLGYEAYDFVVSIVFADFFSVKMKDVHERKT